MASNNKDGGMKEERRRRIAERGSDRMALITGRINALPPTPPSTTSSPTHVTRHAQSLSVFDSHSDQNQLPRRHQRPQSLTAFNADHQNDHKGGAMDKRSTSLASARLKHQGGFRELNSCILASEPTRALSSLIIALVVVFYYMMSKSVFASRPLYILLLTDVTIVLARLHGAKGSVLEETTEEEDVKASGDGHNWGDAVKLLERGLVAYQAIRGLFIDCSIYLVVVVCVTSLM
ncbi:hypothetical protein Fmac_012535 [Flemingia macrophylla]|uniref:Reticulon-like protein n=1 Tax=Flemingia macrophylla TaxID=520843 RepID=A0ABD1MQL8_9FABA